MVSAGLVSAVAEAPWFAKPWSPYALIDGDLRIRAVNRALADVTGQSREQLLGETVFDAFPANPDDPAAGEARGRSLELVLRSGLRDWMGFQRYDVPDPAQPGGFRFKVWMPVNLPVTEDGRVVAVLHHVQDVTPALLTAGASGAPGASYDPLETAATAEELHRLFPTASAETVLGLLTDSVRIVLDTLGTPDLPKATALAKIRIEIHTRTRAQH